MRVGRKHDQRTKGLTNRTRRWLALGIVPILFLAACGGESGATDTSGSVSASESSESVLVGYISMGESDPFINEVSASIRDEVAKIGGVTLVECDAQFLPDKALECAAALKAQGVASVINWQADEAASSNVCDAYGNLPTVAIDVPQAPCEKIFIGADNYAAGIIGGEGLGNFVLKQFDCQYDAYVSIDIPSIPSVNGPRAGGNKEGFEKICGPMPDSKYISIDAFQGGPDQPENTRRQFTDILTALPDAKVILVASPSGDPMAVAAFNAGIAAGRTKDIWMSSQGADGSSRPFIRESPQWVGAVAYFPERYGELVVPAAIKLAKGESVPTQDLMVHEFVTIDNIDSFYPNE